MSPWVHPGGGGAVLKSRIRTAQICFAGSLLGSHGLRQSGSCRFPAPDQRSGSLLWRLHEKGNRAGARRVEEGGHNAGGPAARLGRFGIRPGARGGRVPPSGGEGGANLVIVGTTSDEAKASSPSRRTNTIGLTPSASAPALTRNSKFFFRVFTSDEWRGAAPAASSARIRTTPRPSSIRSRSEQARGIEPPFRQVFEQAMDGTVVGRVSVGQRGLDDSADLMAAINPESVYIIGLAKPSIEVVRHLREKEFEGTICLTSSFYSGEIVDKNLELLEGIYFPQPAFDMQDETRSGPGISSRTSAPRTDTTPISTQHMPTTRLELALHAFREAGSSETSDLRKALLFSIGEFPGVTGIISVQRLRGRPPQPDHVHYPRRQRRQLRAVRQGTEEADPGPHPTTVAARLGCRLPLGTAARTDERY